MRRVNPERTAGFARRRTHKCDNPRVIPLTLYVHLPWCLRRCPYCDFNAHAIDGAVPEEAYVQALLADLDTEAARAPGRPVHAVFFGGGTPSLFSAAAIGAILDHAARRLSLTPDCEVTLEANPGASEYARFAGYRAAGVNRLSIGVQSFDDAMLARLGRVHGSAEAATAIGAARAAGFERINVDLMHGLPGQDALQAAADIERALAWDTGHLSYYQLTLEPNTAFHRDPPTLPDDDALAAIQDAGFARLQAAGYRQYEISAWSRPGEECRHNLNYWLFGDYLGIGAGAHGKLTAGGHISRRWKKRHPNDWRSPDQSRLDGEGEVTGSAVRFEFLLNALRLREGFSNALFHAHTGREFDDSDTDWQSAIRRGLVERTAAGWRASELGWRFLNDLQVLFLPADDSGKYPI